MAFVEFQPDDPPCNHPEHGPPSHQVLLAGTYTWECPGCGEKKTFRVEGYFLHGVDKHGKKYKQVAPWA